MTRPRPRGELDLWRDMRKRLTKVERQIVKALTPAVPVYGALYRPNDQTFLATAGWVTLGFPAASESHLSGGVEHVGSALVAPSTGLYSVKASIYFPNNATGRRDIRLVLDGADVPGGVRRITQLGAIVQPMSVEMDLWLSAGAAVTAQGQHNAGVNLVATQRYLSIVKVG